MTIFQLNIILSLLAIPTACQVSSQETYPQGLRRPAKALFQLFSDTAEGSLVPSSQGKPHSPYDLSFVRYLAVHLKNTIQL